MRSVFTSWRTVALLTAAQALFLAGLAWQQSRPTALTGASATH
jgi:hypothetical protein